MRKSVQLTFKNSIRNTFSSLGQLFGMIMLVVILASVITLMTSINTRVVVANQNLKKDSNQHNVVLQMDPFENATVAWNKIGPSDAIEITNNVQAQQLLMNTMQDHFEKNNSELNFEYSRTDGRDFSQTLNEKGQTMTAKTVIKTTNDKSNGVDNLVISEGRNWNTDEPLGYHEVVLDQTFANVNHIKLGTLIRFQLDTVGEQFLVNSDLNKGISMTPKVKLDIKTIEQEGIATSQLYATEYSNYGWYQVVGLGNSADFLAPVINASGILPNRDTEAIVYVSPEAAGLIRDDQSKTYKFDISLGRLQVASNTEWESYYSIKTKQGTRISFNQISEMNYYFNQLMNKKDQKYVYSINDGNYRYYSRTNLIESTIRVYEIITGVILVVILATALYVMALITRKQIEKARGQIGVMKALGYRKRNIIFNFVMTPLMTSIIGGIIGYLISIGVQVVLIYQMSLYFSLDFAAFNFDWLGFLVAVVIMWFVLTAIAFLIARRILLDSALSLINANSTAKISKWGLLLKKMNLRNSFGSKMRTALLIDASGKMMGVGSVVFFATFLMVFSYMSPNILNKYKTMSYNGIDYSQLVEYAEPIANNPYTFLKTFNKNSTLNQNGEIDGFKYSDVLKGVTGLPLDDTGNYDMDEIVEAYLNGNQSSDFFTPFIASSSDAINGKDISYANSRMLAGTNVTLSNSFFKYLSNIAEPMNSEGFNLAIYSQLSKEWLDKADFLESLTEIMKKESLTIDEKWKNIFNLSQQFYNKYSSTVGLTMTKIGENNDDNEKTRIDNYTKDKKIQQNYLENLLIKDDISFNNLYTLLSDKYESIDVQIGFDYKTKKIKNAGHENYIDLDTFVGDKDTDPGEYQSGVLEFSKWFSSFFALRSDTAIIQAGYSRAPYYVKQYMKNSWDSGNYSDAFNLVNFDSKKEQLGTMINAKVNDLSFKIYGLDDSNRYGLDDSNRYMNLFDTKGNSLNSTLTSSSDNNIIINETISRILRIKKGDKVAFDYNQNLLSHIDSNGAFKVVSIDDWSDSNQRDPMTKGNMGPVPKSTSFIQQGSMNPLNAKFKTDNDNKNDVKIYNGNLMNFGILKTPLTDKFRRGDAKLSNVSATSEIFTVSGVHEGYGTAAAWINNDIANNLLGYDDVENYLWKNQFLPQFGCVDPLDPSNKYNSIFTSESTSESTSECGVKSFQLDQDVLNSLGSKSLSDVSLSDFKNIFLENDKTHDAAEKILKLFKSVDPVFNYKYSQDKNIADLDSVVSIWTSMGDYNPTTMNGNGELDGIGQSAFGAIVPIETSKAIMNQISNVIISILIMIIILVILVTFIIILLTTSLIIADNAKFIATMKVLGYSNRYIAKNVLGMYLIVILSTFGTAFGTAFGTLLAIVTHVLPVGGLVLPFEFTWWIIPAVAFSIFVIYAITIAVGFRSISRMSAIKILQNSL